MFIKNEIEPIREVIREIQRDTANTIKIDPNSEVVHENDSIGNADEKMVTAFISRSLCAHKT